MRDLFPETPEAIDNSARIAEMCDLDLRFGDLHLPQAEVPPGAVGRRIPGGALPPRPRRALPAGRRGAAAPPGLRAVGRPRDRLRQLHARRARLRPLRQEPGHRHGRARQRRRQHHPLLPRHHRHRPAGPPARLRALPQRRAARDAGYRHGLRRRPPRRGDPLRRREVRLRPRGADHHLRHDGRQGGDPRRRPGAGHDLRRSRPRRPARPERPAHDHRARPLRERRAAQRLRPRRPGAAPRRHGAEAWRASPATPAPTPPASSSPASRWSSTCRSSGRVAAPARARRRTARKAPSR